VIAVVRSIVCLSCLTATVAAAELAKPVEKVVWNTDVADAWRISRQQGRPLLVFVTRERCFYCTQMKDRTYASHTIAGTINRSFVPLVLDGGTSSSLVRELRVASYPATFIISPQAVVLDRIDGYVPPETLAARLSSAQAHVAPTKMARSP
jgi:thioredoxin-related protein